MKPAEWQEYIVSPTKGTKPPKEVTGTYIGPFKWLPRGLRNKMLEDGNKVIRSNGSPDSQWQKQNSRKEETLINQTLHIKLKIERHEPH